MVNVTMLLTVLFVLLMCEVSTETGHMSLDNVLKSVREIQSDISQIRADGSSSMVNCNHHVVFGDDLTIIVIFVWASEEDTHAMRSCLYQGIERTRKKIIRMMQSAKFPKNLLPDVTVKFCNRYVTGNLIIRNISNGGETKNETILIALNFYIIDFIDVIDLLIENDRFGRAETVSPTAYDVSAIPTVTSSILPRALPDVDSQVRSFVCNSVQLTVNETGILRQRFFSFLKNSAEEEVLVNSTQTGSVRATLDFDVLALNGSRLGLLNDSNVELLSLSDLHMSCFKYLTHGLNNETNETAVISWMKESVSKTALIVDNKLRLRANMSIPVVSEYGTAKYGCITYCKLQTTTNNDTIEGCRQERYFSIPFHTWQNENFIYKQTHKYCNNIVMHNEEICEMKMKANADYCDRTQNDTRNDWINETSKVQSELFSCQVLAIILAVCLCYIKHNDMKALTSMASVPQSMENPDERIMKYDVFLSYSSKDRPWVESTLLTFIESKGFSVCFDERDFPLGCNLVQTIATAVHESRKVIAVVSPNYLKSGWCAEYEFHLRYTKILNKEAPYNSLLLIKYRDCQLPEHMKCLKYLDYTKVKTVAVGDDNRSLAMKVWSWVLALFRKVEVRDAISENQFFNRLFEWLRS